MNLVELRGVNLAELRVVNLAELRVVNLAELRVVNLAVFVRGKALTCLLQDELAALLNEAAAHGLDPTGKVGSRLCGIRVQAGVPAPRRSKRSRFITLFQTPTKSLTNFWCASWLA